MIKKALIINLVLLICSSITFAQLNLAGKVVDEKGIGLPGANILIVNTNIGTSTDLDGLYSLKIPKQDGDIVLEARYIGYKSSKKTVSVQDGTVQVNFQLNYDILEMEALVVTGTADPQQKKNLGNSIGIISGDELQNKGPQLDAALSGQVAGAMVQVNSGTPGGGTSVRLRGTSSISRSAEPLYIIDGVVIDNSSDQLIDLGGYRSNRIADLDPNDIEKIEVIKGAAAAALYGSRANDGVVQIFTKKGKAGKLEIQLKQSIGVDVLNSKLDVSDYPYKGNTTVTGANGWTYFDQNSLTPVERYDWHDQIYRKGWSNSTSLSIAGGNDKTRYYFSTSQLTQDGVMRGTDYSKQSFRLNLDQYINKYLYLSVNSNYIHSYSNLVPNGGLVGFYGVFTNIIFGPNTKDYNKDSETGIYPSNGYTANPLDVINNWKAPQEIDRLISGAKLSFTPIDNFVMNFNIGYDTYTQLAKEFTPRNSSAPSRIDGYSASASKTSKLMNIDADASYTHNFTKDIKSVTTGGINFQYDQSDIVTATAKNLTMLVDIVQGETQFSSEYINERKTLGYYLQETASYLDKLFLTGSLRLDGSSTFGKDVRWQLFPKFSTTYHYNDNIKLRAAYGFSGGQPVDSYSQFNNYIFREYSGGAGLVNALRSGNPNLKPERQEEFEIGTDFSVLDDRIGIEVTYYNSKTTDLILPKNVALSTGYTEQLANVGVLSNKGIELLVRSLNIRDENFSWTTTLTFSKNTPLIESLSDGGEFALPDSWGIVWVGEGEVPGYFYGYTEDGINPTTGLPIKSATKSIIGDPNPDFVMSLTNDFQIGSNLSVNIQFDAMIGQDVFNFTERMLQTPAFAIGTEYDKEIKGEVPVGYYNIKRSNYSNYIEDGSFVKLRNLSVNYKLRNNFISDLGLESVNLTLSGRNLLTITGYSGMDPEINVAAQSTLVRGFDFATVPIPASYNFSIQLNF
ncbi:MAG: SusC/RagA family TonB-linked outer membrane protein [Bacteroidetes bacterium]|nr:SusC/RagA family TonB-linked outer membrane protein [Bacteroidota bacterium]MBU1115568.1 SusC/RagA family TonB-linked outer membrane protein [Bacteroidota bacterium]MBU1798612.1 SusC/RagA family TonB-linked outer membrane protein [Bacteroidota bacterium]